MNQRYNPEMYMQGRRVFDTAFHRWNAMQNSGDLLVSFKLQNFSKNHISIFYLKLQVKHNAGNALKGFGTFILPTIIVGYSIYRAQMEYDRRARAGEWPINAKNRKWLWYASQEHHLYIEKNTVVIYKQAIKIKQKDTLIAWMNRLYRFNQF